MQGAPARRILVTGANKGIGLAIVKAVLNDYADTFVFLGSRDVSRGEEAVATLLEEDPDLEDRVEVLEIDTSEEASVAKAAANVAAKFGRYPQPLYGIVNNAGIAGGEAEEIMSVNVEGPQRVDKAFMPLLLSSGGRIVYVSSGAAPSFVQGCSAEKQAFFTDPNLTWQDIYRRMTSCLNFPDGTSDFEANGLGAGTGMMRGWYGLSKALLNAYCVSMARQYPRLKINSCSPGFIATDLTSSVTPAWMPSCVVQFAARNFMGAKTTEEGAETPVFLLMGAPEGHGWYYGSDQQRSPLDAYRSPGSPPYTGPP